MTSCLCLVTLNGGLSILIVITSEIYVNVSVIINFSPFILPFCYGGENEILLSIDSSVVKRMTVKRAGWLWPFHQMYIIQLLTNEALDMM